MKQNGKKQKAKADRAEEHEEAMRELQQDLVVKAFMRVHAVKLWLHFTAKHALDDEDDPLTLRMLREVGAIMYQELEEVEELLADCEPPRIKARRKKAEGQETQAIVKAIKNIEAGI